VVAVESGVPAALASAAEATKPIDASDKAMDSNFFMFFPFSN
jgi:hypothetical protein